MKPDAVIFDLDGVITDTAHLHFVAWRAGGGRRRDCHRRAV